MTSNQPLILSPELAQMLRGKRGYTEECKDIAELAISYYRDGKAGQPFDAEALDGVAFPAELVEKMRRFLLACWQQGQNDIEKGAPNEN